MAQHKVFITRKLPGPAEEIIAGVATYEVFEEDRAIPRPVLLQKVKGKDGLLCLLTDKVDAEVMDSAGRGLKVISNYAVGYDNIQIEEAKKRGIVVTNTPGVLTETTADLAWTLLMATARRVVEADAFTRQRLFSGWSPTLFLGVDVYGKTLGIVGLGRIGYAVARRARGFDMRILYYDVLGPLPEKVREVGAEFRPLPELIQESDFITLHTPYSQQTHHLIGEKELRSMKKTAILVNTSRGAVVDEQALVRALREGWIRGAGLDVYEKEPALAEGLSQLPNAVLLPHIASASVETRFRMAEIAAKNLVAVLEGKPPLFRVV